ncbi:dihydrofolate reductase family protein [Niabella yanshanensis]|uniref:Dihydrofolate reductase family protein n=1 Tax=Niabella yanshanensis TaxID=577386 RepID=A0ABZ0W6P4_9BACT|nr:dihydrofolate reductase family protein [Niabella yanshanensis]WQD38157.1 dihydrofolate reductase family protein [Niabella yanshanensis]
MSRIFVSNWITLDGIFSGAGGDTGWFTSDEELMNYNLERLNEADTILMGRITYDLMAGYWPLAQAQQDFAGAYQFMNESRKHIFSTTVNKSGWDRCIFHNEVSPKVINDIKTSAGKDIVILGSGKLSARLHNLRLIDEYHLLLDPQIKVEGRRFFDDIQKSKLKLKNMKKFECGVVYLQYVVVK